MVSETMARRGATSMSKMIGHMCVADSKLRGLTEGQPPVTRTGDYSDVVVADAAGGIIPCGVLPGFVRCPRKFANHSM